MDTTDKQNPQSAEERFREVPESSITHYLENGRRASGNLYLFFKEMSALQKEVAELRGERQRLRDAVNILYDQAQKNMNGAIGAEEVAVATYWEGNKDGLSIVIDLLENPKPPKEP